ncbi:MAG: flagellar basal body L-ring protein FlgH [Planctomycetes bacterium]|nr:flagellar basal body L-ring protein FlgH [Planctomycetota bacterium]
MRRYAVVLAVLILLVLGARPSDAQVSLWSGQAGGGDPNLLRQVKARDFKIHDIVHIVVSVSAEASTDEQTDLEKKSDKNSLTIEEYIKLRKNGLGLDLVSHKPDNLSMDMKGEKKFEGDGSSDRKDTLRTRLAAEITDVKPNGNLVVEARSSFTKNRETTTITLSGVVLPQDVEPDNSLYSYNVADVDINYKSSGPVTDANKRGWLLKILDKVWPF